ncbi:MULTISPECIES: hypothetical protein [Ramlibacter]|uniref:Uncharacterized protein n=1 Tax=Ramlibacter pinisoli TaxID=2682844 RepID=A0A6N8INF3_9BURK|nr:MULTISPECIES: hypothetical protein [Ramlibacter]MBA2963337.1 hypothetical protein [Ramlibacter sp. CGMCC 1.13660]MVQ28304.1 hypothetical protein [Ramlibacter pinisoli]
MQIHQLSVTYQAEQDRVLLRVNSTGGDEMRLWLTRRLMLGLWPLLTKLQTDQVLKMEAAGTELERADEELRRMLAEFRKEELLQRADFQTPYEDKPNLPLGAEPLLVTDVDASPLPNGRLRLGFNERAAVSGGAKPRGFQVELDPKLTQGLMYLLDQALANAQWREGFAGTVVPPLEGETADAADARPRYLN